jgi:thiol-disulfide isomerase/thioredoxin
MNQIKHLLILVFLFNVLTISAQEIIYDNVPKKGDEWKKRVEEINSEYTKWKDSPEKQIAYLRNFTGLKIGSPFPARDFVGINGEVFSKDLFLDKIIVVNYWFVGCTGCKQEEENLEQLSQSFSDNDQIIFISFCRSSEKTAKKYLTKHGEFGYETVASLDKDIYSELFEIVSYPTHSIVKNGVVVENFSQSIATHELSEVFKEIIKKQLE